MRTKTRAVRPRPSKSPAKSSSTITRRRPLPLFHVDDSDIEDNMDNVAPRTSNTKDDDNNDDNSGQQDKMVCDFSDNVEVSENKRSDLDGMEIDWLEEEDNACIRCNRRGKLLVCTSCPIAIHEKCMQCEPKFDDAGKFYCPHCWYKREVSRCRVLRKKAMLAKKALSDFIDAKMVGEAKEKWSDELAEVNGLNVIPIVGKSKCCEASNKIDIDADVPNRLVEVEEDYQTDKDKAKLAECDQGIVSEIQVDSLHPVDDCNDKEHHSQEERTCGIEVLEDSISKENRSGDYVSGSHEFEILEGKEGMQEKDDGQTNGQDEGILGDKEQGEPFKAQCVDEETMGIGTPHESVEDKSETVKASTKNQGRRKDKEHVEEAAPETSVLLRGDVAPKFSELSDSDNELLAVRQRRAKETGKKDLQTQNAATPKKASPQPHSTSEKEAGIQDKKVGPPKKSKKPQESAMTFGKRQRLHWTPEEEDMLREGVHKYSATVNRNIPWRKILEFGQHVFHTTRTPTDLKDKWKNIIAKES